MERRRNVQPGQSPIETLRQLPALVLLERLSFAALAVDEQGAIVFANGACADMLGYGQEELRELRFSDVFHRLPPEASAVAAMRAHADAVVELAHKDGSTVRALMSQSALLRGDDPVALATFQDLTAQLWVDGF
jgi:PAS domain S-box-containing protein